LLTEISIGFTVNFSLKIILEIQELDMKMLRLMRVKKERQNEAKQIDFLRKELNVQLNEKKNEVEDFSKQIQLLEQKIQEISNKTKKLESCQGAIKKVEEFNAITQEMTSLEREKIYTEQKISDLVDKKVSEEETLVKIKTSLQESEANSIALEDEILSSIKLINEEGSRLKAERASLSLKADSELLQIYERLLQNKKDRIVVPIENRTCNGCHITLTAQHENLVRKGMKLVFCEHCSRIHYWQQEATSVKGETIPTKRRRRSPIAT
jgi:uncharacterized protein